LPVPPIHMARLSGVPQGAHLIREWGAPLPVPPLHMARLSGVPQGAHLIREWGARRDRKRAPSRCREGALRLRRRYIDALDSPFFIFLLSVACAAASRATGSRNGEPLT